MNRRSLRRALACAAFFCAPAAAWAEDMALIVANSSYKAYPPSPNFAAVTDLRPALEAAGFRVLVMENLTSDALANAMREVGEQMLDADRLVVVTSGYYASRAGRSWLLTADADQPTAFTIGQHGVSMDALVDILSDTPAQAILAVATREGGPETGWRLGTGVALPETPVGLAVLTGAPEALTEALPGFLVPGRGMHDAAADLPDGVAATGIAADAAAFIEAPQVVLEPPAEDPAAVAEASDIETTLWDWVTDADDLASYERYLDRFPEGKFVAEARARVDELTLTPENKLLIAEEALGLSRDQRRTLQDYLTVLGYDTQGVDGVFGPKTRTAVSAWQASVGAEATGYLTGNQVSQLGQQGEERAEILRQERLAADRALWNRVGNSGKETAVRGYLEDFPDGLFVKEANAALKQIEAEERRRIAAQERGVWARASAAGTLAAYRNYLGVYPNGQFAAEARARVRSLSGGALSPTVETGPESGSLLDQAARRLIDRQRGFTTD